MVLATRIRVRCSLGKRGFHEKAWSCQPEPGFFLAGNQPLTDAEHVRNAVPMFDQSSTSPMIAEGSWHDLGIYRRKRRKAPPDAL
jgi:hypothetical protein